MKQADRNFRTMVSSIVNSGDLVTNRTGIRSLSFLGFQEKYFIANGFPVLESKRTAWKTAIAEMLWFISGKCDDIQGLEDMNAGQIWRPWLKDDGTLGPIYGVQWRDWIGKYGKNIDQLQEAVEAVKAGSDSRRIIINAWRPDELEDMALAPCHVLFQFTARNGKLTLHLYQRSCDIPLGGPFNVCQYSALLCMVAKLANLKPDLFIHTIHDAHIYENQFPKMKLWDSELQNLHRNGSSRAAPKLVIQDRGQKTIDDFELSDFKMENYDGVRSIKFPEPAV